ncbi:MAG: hypothetical protein QF752_05280 [Planctomycetota bacterium]|jgi:hypothetical protein|nr:hypothetical protein [Planctomycetota bacterium]
MLLTPTILTLILFTIEADPNLLGRQWEEFQQSNVPCETWIRIDKEEFSWSRTSRPDCGTAGVVQRMDRSTSGKLHMSLQVRVDGYSLRGSGRGRGTGEYPVKIRIDYIDKEGRFQSWTHGFLCEPNRNRHRNVTQVRRGTWTPVTFDLDLGEKVQLRSVRFYGMGWSFRGAVRSPQLMRRR